MFSKRPRIPGNFMGDNAPLKGRVYHSKQKGGPPAPRVPLAPPGKAKPKGAHPLRKHPSSQRRGVALSPSGRVSSRVGTPNHNVTIKSRYSLGKKSLCRAHTYAHLSSMRSIHAQYCRDSLSTSHTASYLSSLWTFHSTRALAIAVANSKQTTSLSIMGIPDLNRGLYFYHTTYMNIHKVKLKNT